MKDKLVEELEGKKASQGLDLSEFETKTMATKGVDYAIIDPRTGEASATTVTVLGLDSDEYMAFKDAEDKEVQDIFMAQMTATTKGVTPKKNINTKSEEDRIIDKLVVLTKGWKNVLWKGKELAFTADNARMVYTNNVIVRSQVRKFVEERANFFPPEQVN